METHVKDFDELCDTLAGHLVGRNEAGLYATRADEGREVVFYSLTQNVHMTVTAEGDGYVVRDKAQP